MKPELEPPTAEEVADMIGLKEAAALMPSPRPGRKRHYATIWRWVEQGKLRAWKLAGRIHVLRKDVYAMLKPVKARTGPLMERVTPKKPELTRQQKAMDAYLDSVGM